MDWQEIEFDGVRLHELRKARGWSQHKVADDVGAHPSAIGLYERCRRKPQGEILARLIVLFGDDGPSLVKGRHRLDLGDQIPPGWLKVVASAVAWGYNPGKALKVLRAFRNVGADGEEAEEPLLPR